MNAIYARQSVDKADSISIETQIEDCLYEIKREEYRVYKDKGFSGKNTDRPEFQLMIEHIKQGIIKKVVVYKLDRMSRSVLDFARTMATFKDYDVEFVSVNEKFDTSTPMGRAMLNIAIVFAELERETIQQRVLDAYISRSRAGFYMGGRIPYGFKREPITINGINTSMYTPVDGEMEQIQTIFDIYAKPATALSDVIRYLREHKIVKKRDKEWSTPRLSEAMRNPIYVKADMDVYHFYLSRGTEVVNPPESFIGENGCYLYTKDVKLMGKKKDMTQYENMVLVIAPHKGIIEADTWIKCRLKMEANKQLPNARKSYTTWVSGKLKCGKCGYAMRYNKWVGKTVENEYYICSEVSGKRLCEGVGAVRKEFIEAEILRQIKEKVMEIKVEQNRPTPYYAEINKIKAAIAAKEQEIEDMLSKFEGGSEAIMRRLNARVDGIEGEIQELKKELLAVETNITGMRLIDTDTIEKIFSMWDKVSMENRQAVADALITRVLVTKESIEIVWKI